MKEPTTGYAVDQKELRKFVSKVARDAKRKFQGQDGECLLDVCIRDTSRHQQPAGNLPVIHQHLIENEKEWRDAISVLVCNASSALDRLSTMFRIYEHEHNRNDNLMEFGHELSLFARKSKVTIFYSPTGKFPPPPSNRKWTPPEWGTTEELKSCHFQTSGLWTNERKDALAFVVSSIERFEDSLGGKVAAVLVMVKDGSVRVYAATDGRHKGSKQCSNTQG